jgi:hypothetical protein
MYVHTIKQSAQWSEEYNCKKATDGHISSTVKKKSIKPTKKIINQLSDNKQKIYSLKASSIVTTADRRTNFLKCAFIRGSDRAQPVGLTARGSLYKDDRP